MSLPSPQVAFLETHLQRPLHDIDHYGFLYNPPTHPPVLRSANERLMDRQYRKCYRLDNKGHIIALNLASCHIKDLSFLRELRQLQSLNLWDNDISDLSPLTQLQQLQSLNLSSNKISDLSPLTQLQQLRSLNLWDNDISDLSPLTQLQQLQSLNLSYNKISDLSPLTQLQQLQSLYLSSNKISDLSPFTQLQQLQSLNLSYNKISDLSALHQLPRLRTLEVKNNDIEHLRPGLLALNTEIELGDEYTTLYSSISLCGNPVKTPPMEILEQGHQAICDYFAAGKTRPLREAKVLVVGEAEVGKTSLIKQLLQQEHDPREKKTHDIVRHHLPITCKKKGAIDLRIWDFGGQDIMHATHQFFLTKRSLYLLVLNSRQNERQGNIDYWLRLIQSFGGDSPVIIVCNKCDEETMDLPWNTYQAKYPQIRDYVREVSCSEPRGIEEVKSLIAHVIDQDLPQVGEDFPLTWFEVKEELESLTANGTDYFDRSRFDAICSEKNVNPGSEVTLLKLLHELGIVLHFDDEHPLLLKGSPTMEDTKVLNPEWVTAAIYQILNDPTLLKKQGLLEIPELTRILSEVKNHNYDSRQQTFILEMMRRFELIFATTDGDEHLIPSLLPKDTPDTGEWEGCLGFRYTYDDVLPSAIISRFIVRMKEFISQKTYWRYGVVLKREGVRALIRADIHDAKIDIQLKETRDGHAGERRRLLALIRGEFDRIHGSFKQLGVKEFAESTAEPGIYESYQKLLTMERNGKESVWVEELEAERPLVEFLDGVSLDRENPPNYEKNNPRENSPRITKKPPPDTTATNSDQPAKQASWIKTSLLSAVIVLAYMCLIAALPEEWLTFKILLGIAGAVTAFLLSRNPAYFWRRMFMWVTGAGIGFHAIGFSVQYYSKKNDQIKAFTWDGTPAWTVTVLFSILAICALIGSILRDKTPSS